MSFKYERKINYYETDRMGVVHHSNYIRFLEEARCRWLEELNISMEKLEELGKNRPEAKKLANSYDFFVAQTDLMPTVGRFLGPVLGPRKKMPKPIPASANPETILGRLRSTIKIRVKDQPIIQSIVGSEDMTEAQVAENIDAIMDVLDRNLEKGSKQIKAMYLKTTMGPVTRVI